MTKINTKLGENRTLNKTQNKIQNTNQDDWKFSIDKQKLEKLAKNEIVETKKFKPKMPNLTLDESALPENRTRSAMAVQLEANVTIEEEDIFNYAPLLKRGLPLVVDILFIYGIFQILELIAPWWRLLIQYFLDQYQLYSLIPEPFMMEMILWGSRFLALFFLQVIPCAFFNSSLGKKIFSLRVRGAEVYSISISQAFMRELVMKPLSILVIAGFVTPFFSKKKQSLHDMIARTVVIEEI
jgi:uncharacterized RDD family membrane protein YckC